jgi:hypothetical protein
MLTTAALSRPATLGQGSIGRTVLPTLNQRHSLHCLRGTLRGRAAKYPWGEDRQSSAGSIALSRRAGGIVHPVRRRSLGGKIHGRSAVRGGNRERFTRRRRGSRRAERQMIQLISSLRAVLHVPERPPRCQRLYCCRPRAGLMAEDAVVRTLQEFRWSCRSTSSPRTHENGRSS